MKYISIFALATVFLTRIAYAHGGGLNSEGCHTNHRTGDYHCHRTSTIDQQAPQKKGSDSTALQPTCYTGPRGGTYTITPSGRKNYNGC
jgi:hypothetical protein